MVSILRISQTTLVNRGFTKVQPFAPILTKALAFNIFIPVYKVTDTISN